MILFKTQISKARVRKFHLCSFLFFLTFIILTISCSGQESVLSMEESDNLSLDSNEKYKKLFEENPGFISNGFDFPVGKPNAKGYYNAQGFGGDRFHLGDDWNANTGGESDLGHPIYSVGNGLVSEVKDYGGGWGKVLRIVHKYKDTYIETLYAHCNEIFVKVGVWIKKGDKIASIGNNNGMYKAHLHFEIRENPGMPIGGGYSKDTKGYLNPFEFISKNRK
jgi:murein DD-endopeptidase MepM/ murein hydrolase activator NlpD